MSYLKIALLHFLIAFVCLLFMSCTIQKRLYKPNCVDRTIYVYETLDVRLPETPKRIAIGPTTISTSGHVQVQVFLNGKWEWVQLSEYNNNEFYYGKKDWFFNPDTYVTFYALKKYQKKQVQKDKEK